MFNASAEEEDVKNFAKKLFDKRNDKHLQVIKDKEEAMN